MSGDEMVAAIETINRTVRAAPLEKRREVLEQLRAFDPSRKWHLFLDHYERELEKLGHLPPKGGGSSAQR